FERWNRCREHIDKPCRLVTGHHMTAAKLAKLPLAERCLLESCEVLGAGLHLHGILFPEREGIDRPTRPGAARAAVAIAHGLGLTGDFDLDCAAEAASDMTH